VPTPAIRVLIAEDYEPFRRFLSSTVQNRYETLVISEVADGLEAVQKARELQPELVLLDIGLPRLNGIQVIRQIRKLSPRSRILFVTQESSADLMHEAFQSGAAGYLIKADAGRELTIAVDAVLRGERYVSTSLAGHEPLSDVSARDRIEGHPISAFIQQQRMQNPRRHEVRFYSDDRNLLDGFSQFLTAALRSGNAAIFIGAESHRHELLGRLHACRLDMSAAIEQGRYLALDNAETLSTFMVNDVPDPAQFFKATDDLIMRAARSVDGDRARVVACGECAPLLWERGNAEGAIQLERLWDQIAKSYGVRILCGYLMPSFQGEDATWERICAEHSEIHSC
jgi:DNA-binding NarL/FixJ family response regulator